MKRAGRLQQLQKRHTAAMRDMAKQMAAYTDDQLRELATTPHRAHMQQMLTDARLAIAASTSRTAKLSLEAQAGRLQRALDNPAVAA